MLLLFQKIHQELEQKKKKERKKSYREGVLERGDQKEMASETEEGTEAVLNRRQKKSTN